MTVQAHFAGDSNYTASDSAIQSYSTLKHAVNLMESAPTTVPWGRPIDFAATLIDVSNGGTPLSGEIITFTGTGVIPSPQADTTNSSGQIIVASTAPNTVATGWTYQAKFAGDALYDSMNSAIGMYNTAKHTTSLTLVISPSSVHRSGKYSVSGTLTDVIASTPLAGRTITFTASSPITISSKTTDSFGSYSATGLKALKATGSYFIQSHFTATSLYEAANSPSRTLTVTR